MSSINLQAKELSVKVVYYGPGLGGKTTSLIAIHRRLKPSNRGEIVSLATGTDRTLYFDFLPVHLPDLRGFRVRIQLYTVPGQVHYNATRKLVLNGCDGVVFVADSQEDRLHANVDSLDNLRENLRDQGRALETMPLVLQYNKRDCQDITVVADLDAVLNAAKVPALETIATTGEGIMDGLKAITTLVLKDLSDRGIWSTPAREEQGQVMVIREPRKPLDVAPPPEATRTLSSRSPLPPRPQSGASPRSSTVLLSDLLEPGVRREQVRAAEGDLARGDFFGAVQKVRTTLESSNASGGASEFDRGLALIALLHGISRDRYLRMCELLRRAESGAVTLEDATFAVFFLIDFELR